MCGFFLFLSVCLCPSVAVFFFKFFFPLYGKKTSAKLAWQPLPTCPPKWKLSPIACVSYHTCWVHATCCAQLHYLACWLLLTYPKDKMITGHAVQIHTDKTSCFFKFGISHCSIHNEWFHQHCWHWNLDDKNLVTKRTLLEISFHRMITVWTIPYAHTLRF